MKSPLYPFKSNHIKLNGIRYHYVDEGQGEAVLMIHGNPTWSFYYRELIKALSPHYRVIAPDHIGCGLSDKPDDDHYDYTLKSRVSDLDNLISNIGLEKITLIVHDWGGMIGMAWATKHPSKIARIVVLNTSAFPLPKKKSFPFTLSLARTPLIGSFLIRGLNAFVVGANHFCVTRKKMPPAIADGYCKPYTSWANRIAVHRFVEDIPLYPNDRAYPILQETAGSLKYLSKKPMLICWGMQDFVFDHHFLDEWIDRFPHAKVYRFADCGHYILEDASDEIIPIILKFLKSHPQETNK